MTLYDLSVKSDINEINDYINDPATKKKLDHRDKLLVIRDNVNAYHTKIVNAHDAFYSQPVIDGEKFETIQLILDKTAEDLGLGESTISFPSYNSGTMDFSVNAAGSKEMVQKLPSLFVDNLLEETYSDNKGYYEAASYGGYTVTQSSEEGSDDEKVSFQVTIAIKGRESAYKPERDDKKSEQKAE